MYGLCADPINQVKYKIPVESLEHLTSDLSFPWVHIDRYTIAGQIKIAKSKLSTVVFPVTWAFLPVCLIPDLPTTFHVSHVKTAGLHCCHRPRSIFGGPVGLLQTPTLQYGAVV